MNKQIIFFLYIAFHFFSFRAFHVVAQESSNRNKSIRPLSNKFVDKQAIQSIEIGYTISKIRTAKNKNKSYIVASSYEGTVLRISFDGQVLWKHELSGFMNHDIWCQDIDYDGIAEVLAANADGSLYCLDSKGKLLWKFSQSEAPIKSVCVINKENKNYVVCGGYDKNIYYLSPKGELLKTIASNTYSIEKPWGKNGKLKPEPRNHVTNFLRPLHKKNGTECLIVHGIQNSNSGRGSLYVFDIFEDKPIQTIKLKKGNVFGELRTRDVNGDGTDEILIGGTGEANRGSGFLRIDIENPENQALFNIKTLYKKIDAFGYRVTQPVVIKEGKALKYLTLFGSRILLSPINMNPNETEVLACKYAFNDIWNDKQNNRVILASAQSGGSAIHIINLENSKWKKEYANLNPIGKIETILKNTAEVKKQLKTFKQPVYQKESASVYFMTEKRKDDYTRSTISRLEKSYSNPIFLNGFHMPKQEKWDRSSILNEKYRNKKDRRKKYVLSQQEVIDFVTPKYKNAPGISYWGGHGNDPYMFQLSTTKKIVDQAKGKQTVLIYPELEDYTKDFEYVMNDLFYPLANYIKDKNGKIYVRTKHTFWQANVYLPVWSKLVSGDYSSVFVPSMEETTDKSMELSLASRMGIWSSGAVDSWGARCARDNASYDRTRQYSHQMLPNHFLRMMVYNIANGAQYINNFALDQEYISLLWKLIAKGALYVPNREDILSISPVHLSMTAPNEHFLNEGSNTKWLTFYDEEKEKNTPLVFSHLNGTWPGAPVTEWDFSRYAANATERRLNFIPKYENGMVLITPPQKGIFADKKAKRKPLPENLHAIYRGIMKEYITDGKDYISSDGKKRYNPTEYYKVIEEDIKKGAKLLPVTVTGNVGWVVSQVSSKHLRLTIVDNGYINPNSQTATITFNTITPLKIKDVLNDEVFKILDNKTIKIDIPLGMFRFVDIELKEEF
ncbi:hypothetical protein A8C32_16900 [Flavivirga aquatica]|uniref:Lambda-carrageenase n=1 Tax=Flavivirga aquatica TaxID=1849968 RepID=A0A1E5T8J0_9FLAO|nr:PQQ-binding-like beta-propeller repeat protein [Flavivirga aquatica]OEK07658.1 hypothetical protein A8C32_16900 [Flavivirga aquatica]